MNTVFNPIDTLGRSTHMLAVDSQARKTFCNDIVMYNGTFVYLNFTKVLGERLQDRDTINYTM